jgi:hypothetical protein
MALVFIALDAGVTCLAELNDRLGPPLEHPAILYRSLPTHDPVGRLNARLQAGSAHLNFDEPQGYLRSVLKELKVPVESQVAVFSKSSQQKDLISPQNPRTIFFNDAVSVAWMYGGFIELASHDPRQGMIFYTLAQKETNKPTFQRRDDCVQCHVSDASLGVPGMMVRSLFTAPDGRPLLIMGAFLIDHRSPLEERWGGYYVTGATAEVRHLGNAVATDEDDPNSMITPATLQVASLVQKFDTGHYLSPYSDVGALMVFDHQMYMMNLITRVGWEARAAQYDAAHGIRVDIDRILRDSAEELVDYLLFLDEPPLPKPIQSAAALRASPFGKVFTEQGPFDKSGRSLRELDLQSRLLRYPCSYMIYSAAFDAMPDAAKAAIYTRLWQVLSGSARGDKYRRQSLADRRAIVEILRDTKPDLAPYFGPAR